jgi:TonB family protein
MTGYLAILLVLVGFRLGEAQMGGQVSSADHGDQANAGNVTPPILIKRVQPAFPGDLQSQVEGVVLMDVTIVPDGTVQDIKVTHGLPQLIPYAVHAVAQWRYSPARINGVAVPYKTTIAVHFNIAPDASTAAAANAAQTTPRIVPSPEGVLGVKPILPPAPAGVMRISARVMDGMLEKRVEPVYPADSAAADARGVVIALATIGKTGAVENVAVLSGPLRFRDAATDAVMQWRYRPYLIDGVAVPVQTTITLSFAPPH